MKSRYAGITTILLCVLFHIGCLPSDVEFQISGTITAPAQLDLSQDNWLIFQGFITESASHTGIAQDAESWPNALPLAEDRSLVSLESFAYTVSGMQASCPSAQKNAIRQLVVWIDVGRKSSTESGPEGQHWTVQARPQAGDWISIRNGSLDWSNDCVVQAQDFDEWLQVTQ